MYGVFPSLDNFTPVTDSIKLFIYRIGLFNQIIHFMIVRFDIHGCDLPISIEKMLDKIMAHESEEAGVLIPQLLEVHVFGGVYGLVIEGFIHCDCIILDYPFLVILKL